MKNRNFLILDQGGHGGRALVFNQRGEMLAHTSVAVKCSYPQSGRVEQNPQELLDSLVKSAERVIKELTAAGLNNLVCAGLVTQRSSLVAWDKITGEALYPVISWQDRRAAGWLAEQALDQRDLHARTGLRANAHYGASKMHWCLESVPAVRRAYQQQRLVLGPLASFLIKGLTGNPTPMVDPVNASRTLLWNANNLCWDQCLLDRFGIPLQVLPQLVSTEHEFGELTIGNRRIPLRLVNGDQSAALFATGKLEPATAYINMGTGAFVSASWPERLPVPDQLLRSLVHQSRTTLFVAEGTVNAAATALDWAQKRLGVSDIEGLDRWAEQEQELPLFINSVAGLGSPYWCETSATFIGEGTASQKMIAVLESILFLLCENLDLMKSHGFKPRRVLLSGGLSQLDSLGQKLSNLTGLEVFRPRLVEASAQGAAWWLSGCPGDWQVLIDRRFRPNPDGKKQINQRYHRWREMLHQQLEQD